MNHILDLIDQIFSGFVDFLEQILFFDLGGLPLIILWLLIGGIFCTLRMGLVSIRGFNHALKIAAGRYDGSSEASPGSVTSFQALATALSASVGLGNIAGVAIAIQMGGPGAVFWMTIAAFFGMSSKFVECTLGLKYRMVYTDGTVMGGPMYYLRDGLDKLGQGRLGQLLATIYGVAGMGSAVGAGNMFQANQSFATLTAMIPNLQAYDWVYGLGLALVVGLVIVGGINRISTVTSRLVPVMVGIYILGCLWVLGINFTVIPSALRVIIQEAFSSHALEGGLVGVLVQGIRRSAFSNGAGMGTAAIAHSVAKTSEPIQEGIVSMLEPFIDTIIICNLTALVIITTGIYGEAVESTISGSALATMAFGQVIDWFPFVLVGVIGLFAFSTMITWCYYGEKCCVYVFGESSRRVFKGFFLICVFLGAIINLGAITDFSDMMLLTLALPNLLGCLLLSGQVAEDLQQYWQTLPLKMAIKDP